MKKYRESFWISEEPRNVIFLDHVVQYCLKTSFDESQTWIIVYLNNGTSVTLLAERLEELEDALYGRV